MANFSNKDMEWPKIAATKYQSEMEIMKASVGVKHMRKIIRFVYVTLRNFDVVTDEIM